MNNKILIIIPVLAVIVVAMLVLQNTISDYDVVAVGDQSFYSDTIKIDDVIIDVQIADTVVKRDRGLMFQEQTPYDQGMLFIYEELGNYAFWMYNMGFSLDIIWFDENGNAVHIKRDVPPCSTEPEYCTIYDPGAKALYVFEATAGFADRFGITEDSKFSWIVDKTS
ncbi:MAG: DUF192 domain-containing protein [Nitrosopumilus sp.]|nr:DUF192 domain-containing protein [Nitrosopumilus sp.]